VLEAIRTAHRFVEFVASVVPAVGREGRSCERRRAFIVCDYIAGVTDRYATAEHRRRFDEMPQLQLFAAGVMTHHPRRPLRKA
jgi:Phosphohydrolase-associated domain